MSCQVCISVCSVCIYMNIHAVQCVYVTVTDCASSVGTDLALKITAFTLIVVSTTRDSMYMAQFYYIVSWVIQYSASMCMMLK